MTRRTTLAVPPGYEISDEGRVVVLAAERELVRGLGLERLETALASGELLRATPHKAISRIRTPRGLVYVKRYDYDRREVFLKAAVKANFPVFSGPRELENALALLASGFRVPRPLAAGEADSGWRRRSFVALEEVQGTPLEKIRPPRNANERRALVRAVAALVREFHAAGFWHRDLYLANVILDEATGTLGLVDLERVRHKKRGPGDRARRKDLAALDYSAIAWSATDRVRFLRTYMGRRRLGQDGKRLARRTRKKALSFARKGSKT